MGLSCSNLFGKKRVKLAQCDVCCCLCNVVDLVPKQCLNLCTLCNIDYETGTISDVFI